MIVPLWKAKADANDPNTYRGIILLRQHFNVLESPLKARLTCKVVENIVAEQHGLRKGRTTIDAICTMR